MKYKDFEDYLQEKHAEQYSGTDDCMPDDYVDWEQGLEPEDLMNYAERYGKEVRNDILINIEKAFYKNHNPDKDCLCERCLFYKDIKVALDIK